MIEVVKGSVICAIMYSGRQGDLAAWKAGGIWLLDLRSFVVGGGGIWIPLFVFLRLR